jgi:predicted NAD-dependent protein-ADP-ribosyltransferase YbiA (DUF1768 family)
MFVLGSRKVMRADGGNETAYWPMYLVTKKRHMVPIGVFEIKQEKYHQVLDGANNVDVEKLSVPLLFARANREYITKKALTMDEYTQTVALPTTAQPPAPLKDDPLTPELKELYQTIPVDLRDTFNYTPVNILPLLKPESRNTDKNMIAEYKDNPPTNPNIIQQTLQNKNYNIIETMKDGNCFFDAITKAFATIGHQTTPEKLRELLSNAATEADFVRYRDIYNVTHNAKTTYGGDIKRLSGEYNMIKSRMENTLDRNDRIQLYKSGQQIAGAHEKAKQIAGAVGNIAREFAFMQGVNTLAEFKKKLLTNNYWADEWSIAQLQQLLKIKVIILSDSNDDGRKSVHVVCDTALEGATKFYPRFYIIVEYSGGNHYRLVSYKGKSIFQFSEIPNGLKAAIFNTCRMNGRGTGSLYALIPDFKPYANAKNENQQNMENRTLTAITNNADPNLVLIIGMCMNNPKINTESGDAIPPKLQVENDYVKLVTNKLWRKQLSADWSKTRIAGKSDDPWLFTLDDRQWASVEHYVQAAKFKRTAPTFYDLFTLTSRKQDDNDTIAMNVKKAKAAGSKSGEYTVHDKQGKEMQKEQLRPKNITMDPDYNAADALMRATRAKYAQNPDLADILLLTKNATLKNACKKGDAMPAIALMKVRDTLSAANPHRS